MRGDDPCSGCRPGQPRPAGDSACRTAEDGVRSSRRTTRRGPCTTLTGWALEQGVSLEVARGTSPDARGRVPANSPAARRRRRDEASLFRQVRYTNKTFWRNPASAFFTFAFPLLFLVIFTTLVGNNDVDSATATSVKSSTFYVASMAAFGLIGGLLHEHRDLARLHPRGGHPQADEGHAAAGAGPTSARASLHAALVGFLLIAITVVFGVLVTTRASRAASTYLGSWSTVLVGAGCFAAIGLAVSGWVPNADAGPPIINAIILPLLFLSGVFIFVGPNAPAWVRWVGRIFPVRHLVDAMRASFLGLGTFQWCDVVVMGLWLVIAATVAARTFKWEPNR